MAGLVVLYHFDPSTSSFYPRCVFKTTTGLDCPGCGSTRALYHFIHGDFATAFRFNPILFMIVGALMPAIPSFWHGRTAGYLMKPWFAWSMAAMLAVWWIVRNTPLYPW